MRIVYGIASLGIVTGFCLVQACGGDDAAAPSGETDAGQSSSSSGAASSSGGTSSSGGSSGTSSSGGTDAGGDAEAGTDGGKSKMTFFASSKGNATKDGNLGGLAGADTLCKTLATAAGAGDHTWAAYLSDSNTDAKDRIGTGPWMNKNGVEIAKSVADLHAQNFNVKGDALLDETGAKVPATEHDILTGTNQNGTKNANRCNDWASNDNNDDARVGHSDSDTTANNANDRWNTAHQVGCDAQSIKNANGGGRIYCFAKD